MARPRHLSQRIFPDIDQSLHCVGVKANDQLDLLCKKKELSKTDVDMIKELTNILLLIKKNIKHKKKATTKDDTQPTESIEDLIG